MTSVVFESSKSIKIPRLRSIGTASSQAIIIDKLMGGNDGHYSNSAIRVFLQNPLSPPFPPVKTKKKRQRMNVSAYELTCKPACQLAHQPKHELSANKIPELLQCLSDGTDNDPKG